MKQHNDHIMKYESESAYKALSAFRQAEKSGEFTISNLFYCRATIYETDTVIALRSYATIVAVYDKESCTMYDILRVTYGYTATSAKHIAKFRNWLRLRFPFSILRERRIDTE